MIKNIVIILSFGIVLEVHAMEKKLVCYLAKLPFDVQNCILFFVKDDETNEKFFERTEKIKVIPKNCYNKFLLCNNTAAVTDILRAFCPDKSKLALFEVFCDDKSRLTVVDKEKKERILINNMFNQGDYKHIALSRCANLIATIEHRVSISIPLKCYGPQENILTVKNLITQKKCEFEVSGMYAIFSIAFNKQGTHVIVHGKGDAILLDRVPIHKIFLINNNEAKKIDSIINIDLTKKTSFQNYLIERRICKCIEYST